jgi:hypothetical protein
VGDSFVSITSAFAAEGRESDFGAAELQSFEVVDAEGRERSPGIYDLVVERKVRRCFFAPFDVIPRRRTKASSLGGLGPSGDCSIETC